MPIVIDGLPAIAHGCNHDWPTARRMLAHQRAQRLPRSNLEQNAVRTGEQRFETLAEAYRMTHVAAPIACIRPLPGCDPRAWHVGHQPHPWLAHRTLRSRG